jgi:phosphoribosyl 1,2-cyclic phosphodiesterase
MENRRKITFDLTNKVLKTINSLAFAGEIKIIVSPRKKAKVKALVLTHISQRYEAKPKIILDEAKVVFPNTKIVKDLDKIEL